MRMKKVYQQELESSLPFLQQSKFITCTVYTPFFTLISPLKYDKKISKAASLINVNLSI